MAATEFAVKAQVANEKNLLKKRNVVGVAVGLKDQSAGDPNNPDDVAIVVLVQEKQPLSALSADDIVPPEVEGVKTDVMEVGFIRALQATSPRARIRNPIPGGVSIGHPKITAGTLGVLVYDRDTGQRLILSNNHVLANANEALPGDPILQPGVLDGGQYPADMVAKLERFVPLHYFDGEILPPKPPPPDLPEEPTPPPTTPTPPPLPPDPLPEEPAPTQPPTDSQPPTPTQPPTTPTQPPTNGTEDEYTGCDVAETIALFANLVAGALGSEKRLSVADSQAASIPNTSAQTTVPASSKTADFNPKDAPQVAAQTVDNLVDVAVARPINDADFTPNIRHIGTIAGTKQITLGMPVRKAGRTTDYTESTVTLVNATINVSYNTSRGPRTARFVNQVFTGAMSAGGDSGSLIVDGAENLAVGLLFAGSGVVTVFTPISRVLDVMNVRF